MPRKDRASYREYMREYMARKRAGLIKNQWWAV